MKLRYLKHPRTGRPDMMITLSTIAVVSASLKFLFDGSALVELFGHCDSTTYAAFLGPILGAHGFLEVKNKDKPTKIKIDDPDAGAS